MQIFLFEHKRRSVSYTHSAHQLQQIEHFRSSIAPFRYIFFLNLPSCAQVAITPATQKEKFIPSSAEHGRVMFDIPEVWLPPFTSVKVLQCTGKLLIRQIWETPLLSRASMSNKKSTAAYRHPDYTHENVERYLMKIRPAILSTEEYKV